MRRRLAFTLIEITLVLTVVGILVAIALPRYHDLTVRAEAAKVIGDLRVIELAAAAVMVDSARWPVTAAVGKVPEELRRELPNGFLFERSGVRYQWLSLVDDASTIAAVGAPRVRQPRPSAAHRFDPAASPWRFVAYAPQRDQGNGAGSDRFCAAHPGHASCRGRPQAGGATGTSPRTPLESEPAPPPRAVGGVGPDGSSTPDSSATPADSRPPVTRFIGIAIETARADLGEHVRKLWGGGNSEVIRVGEGRWLLLVEGLPPGTR